jgi:hypothetical protein
LVLTPRLKRRLKSRPIFRELVNEWIKHGI